MHPPGLRLRQTREALGLTYRDVERASYQIAVNRGRSDFILHISRLADIENRGVVPGIHKLYSLAAILHLDPLEISAWYEAPLRQTPQEGASFPHPGRISVLPPSRRPFCTPRKARPTLKVPSSCRGGRPMWFSCRTPNPRLTVNIAMAMWDCPTGA